MTKDLFKILAIMSEQKIYFCFQSSGIEPLYNLVFEDMYNKTHMIHSSDFEVVLNKLFPVWGHLLDGDVLTPAPVVLKQTATMKPTVITPTVMPIPLAMPMP